MGPLTVFLDANILFSSALGGEAFSLLWELARKGAVRLVSSRYCVIEARENLLRKRPAAGHLLEEALGLVQEVPPGDAWLPWAEQLIHAKDAPVLAAAAANGAAVLLTGDMRHFGPLMERTDLPLQVRAVRSFLLDGL